MDMNPFHSDALDPFGKAFTAIKKGDVVGHEFHGNQWSTGAGGRVNAHADKIASYSSRVRQAERDGETRNFGKEHNIIANQHIDTGNRLNEMVRQGKADPATMHDNVKDMLRGAELAANAHFAAARAHDAIAFDKQVPYAQGDAAAQLDEAEALSHAAASMTDNWQRAGRLANQ